MDGDDQIRAAQMPMGQSLVQSAAGTTGSTPSPGADLSSITLNPYSAPSAQYGTNYGVHSS